MPPNRHLEGQVAEWVERLKPLFQAAGDAHRIHSTECDQGLKAYKGSERFKANLDRFWETTREVDGLIDGATKELKQGKTADLALVLAYLKVPGRYFRSGYTRARIWRLLKKVDLGEEGYSALRRIILEQIPTADREIREIQKWIPRVNTSHFQDEIRRLDDGCNALVHRRVGQILRMYFASDPP